MPKRVDPDVRREQVADAVIDEIAEHGLRSVTLARIAARTGLAIGSIRHYFGDALREVMRFTLNVLMQRILRRARTLSETLSTDPVARITEIVAFAAPTSDQEHREAAAYVEYRVMARTEPEFAADIAAMTSEAAEAIRSLLREALAGRSVDDAALHREALLLFSLIEGLSFSSATSSAPLDEADVRAVVAAAVRRTIDSYPLSGKPADPADGERGNARGTRG